MNRVQKDGNAGMLLGELAGSIEAVRARHDEIEDDKIRFAKSRLLHRRDAVRCFRANSPPGVSLEQRAKQFPNSEIVIGDQEFHSAPLASALSRPR